MAWTIPYDPLAVRVYGVLIDPLVGTLRPKVMYLCHKLGVDRVLDIASATGAQCRLLAKAGMQATGVDLSEAMIAAARRRSGRNVRYIHGSAYDLPFDDGSFDASLLLLALHEHAEKERTLMLAEALRVVRPDGYLIIADYNRPRLASIHGAWHVIRLIEALAGVDHRAGFNDFVSRGGLAGFLARHALAPVREHASHFGAIGVAVIRRD